MKKHCCSLLVVLLSCLLASCGDDDYRYPSVKQDFLTAFSGTDGRLESVLTDEGERLRIVEGASGLRVSADTAVRIVANYETLAIGDGDVAGAKLYALLQTVSPVPLVAAEFEEGVKTEPSEIQSIWRGYDYLNIIVKVKQQGKHLFHFDFAPFLMYELDWMGLRRVLAAAVQNKKEALSAEQSLLLTYEENTGLIRTASHFGYGNRGPQTARGPW